MKKQDFHGIVFTETRSAVHHLAAMLREYPHMKDITFIEFTGHGKAKASKEKIKGEGTHRLEDLLHQEACQQNKVLDGLYSLMELW